MSSIIVAFSKRDVAVNIRNILVRGGIDVTSVCVTGAQVLHQADTLDAGIVVCGYRFPDMLYSEIRECLPKSFQLLLITSQDKWSECLVEDGIVGLTMPIKVHDLLETMEMMLQTQSRQRKKRRETLKNRNDEQQKVISQAKQILMERNNMTEPEAHRYLQQSSMNNGTNMIETAQMVLTIMCE